jgi:class I lanthipeptide synthase
MPWKPLLDGAQRDAAVAAVRDIVAALADSPPCTLLEDETEASIRVTNASLALGDAGTAVSFGYLSLIHADEQSQYAATSRRLIGNAAGVLASQVMIPTLYGGFVGIAWALAKLRVWGIVNVGESSFAAVDKALLQYVDRDDWPNAVELIYGLAGCLVYALARLPNPDAQRVLERGLQALEASAEKTAEGYTWFVPASQLHSATLERAPEGCYNLGLSHGNPGIFSVVAEIHRAGIDPPRSRRLLEESVRWVLAQELDGGLFPSLTGPGVDPKPARVSWCYGAPGIPIALMRAARALGRDDWHETALRLARVAAETPFEASGVNDPPFCHGSVGLMHQFNRLHQETGIPLFADAARAWFDRTLAFRVEGEGVAGFSARSLPGSAKYPEPGLLYGVAGIAAALAAAVSDVEPSWDAMFALSDAGTA